MIAALPYFAGFITLLAGFGFAYAVSRPFYPGEGNVKPDSNQPALKQPALNLRIK